MACMATGARMAWMAGATMTCTATQARPRARAQGPGPIPKARDHWTRAWDQWTGAQGLGPVEWGEKGLHDHTGVKNGLHGHTGARMTCMSTQEPRMACMATQARPVQATVTRPHGTSVTCPHRLSPQWKYVPLRGGIPPGGWRNEPLGLPWCPMGHGGPGALGASLGSRAQKNISFKNLDPRLENASPHSL